MAAKRVLITGDVGGRMDQLCQRVAAVNAKSGPFDVLLCVGPFFEPSAGPTEEESDDLGELLPYLTGEKRAPVPTYFLGGFGKGCVAGIQACASSFGNVHYLGRHGVAEVAGLRVAFLDGTYDGLASTQPAPAGAAPPPAHYTRTDLDALQSLAAAATDVDFFLTCEWPRGVAKGVLAASLPDGASQASAAGSPILAELARVLRPRYHVAGGQGVFWQRQPYLNRDVGTGSHVTRFISLASVGNDAKLKSLHALQVVPASQMGPDAIAARPPDTTASPYEGALKREADDESEHLGDHTWRWQGKRAKVAQAEPSRGKAGVIRDHRCTVFLRNLPYAASEADVVDFFRGCGVVEDYRRGATPEGKLHSWGLMQFADVAAAEKACQMNGMKLMGRDVGVDMAKGGAGSRDVKPVDGCWFCLSNPNCSSWLVVSIGQESYVCMDKAPIDDMHVQVIPIEHFPSSLALPESAHHEMERYYGAVRAMYASAGRQPLMFERHLTLRKKGGNHMQVNLVPVSPQVAARAKEFIAKMGAEAGIKAFEVFPAEAGERGRDRMRDYVGDMEYLAFTLPDGTRMVHVIRQGERHPMTFAREVAAALAGRPDRADWKACEVGREGEERAAEALRERFREHDIMGGGE